jgi:hypothetical protein
VTIYKICSGKLENGRTCGKLIAPPFPGGIARCPDHYRADNRRRGRKQHAAGRTSARWKQLSREAKERAGYRCQVCGVAEEPTPRGWLDVHLRDESRALRHDDPSLTVDDFIVTCKRDHGAHHGTETPGGGVSIAAPSQRSPHASHPREKPIGGRRRGRTLTEAASLSGVRHRRFTPILRAAALEPADLLL